MFKKKSKPMPDAPGKPSLIMALGAQKYGKKKMALGGAVEAPSRSGKPYDRNPGAPMPKPDNTRRPKEAYLSDQWASSGELADASNTSMRPPQPQYMADHFAEGGMVDSIAEAVMRKVKSRMMAEGGMVDLEANSEEQPNQFDPMNAETANEEQYDLSQLSKQPKDSNELGDDREDEEENKDDMVSAIRKKVQAKKGR